MGIVAAIIAAFITSLIAASIWAGITVATHMQIGYVAIGVGFLVGLAVRTAGGGSTPAFGAVGAIFALFGCALGNLLSGIAFAAKEFKVSFFETLMQVNPEMIGIIMQATFSPMDLLFYGIAIFCGYKYSMAEE